MKSLTFLIGFSFTGKSEAAKRAATLLGWDFLDIDEEIEKLCGKPIYQIFAERGEAYFRQLEKRLLKEACLKEKLLVATGGGIVIDEENRRIMQESGLVILLEASPHTIYRRLLQNKGGPPRPLLEVEEPFKRIEELKSSRLHFYSIAHLTIKTDNLTVQEVAEKVAHYSRLWILPPKEEVVTPTNRCPVFIGQGVLSGLGIKLQQAKLKGSAVVISDSTVLPLYKQPVEEALTNSGFPCLFYSVPAGEGSKSLEGAAEIYRFLAKSKIERQDIIIALGGGMVGDLAGFVASTYLRGLPLIQIPTTLLAMVDSAIGGKTAINLPQGKNLVGSFYQPKLVLIDLKFLKSLPQREISSGWAEIVKYGFIRDIKLVQMLDERTSELKSLETGLLAEVVLRCVGIKARIVSEDEREEKGLRTILNFGHTIAHGLEASTGYSAFLHGEAVAIGMVAETRLGERLGITPQKTAQRLEKLLQGFGLPTSAPAANAEEVLKAIKLDKKSRWGKINWVLLKDIAQPIITDKVPISEVKTVLDEITGGER